MAGALALLVGATVQRVAISNRTITDTVLSPTDADAGYLLSSTGQAVELRGAGTTNISNEWLRLGSASAFDARATVLSGTLSSGTAGSWLNLGTTRDWHRNRTSDAVGTTSCQILVEIRDAASLTVLASATITLNATVE